MDWSLEVLVPNPIFPSQFIFGEEWRDICLVVWGKSADLGLERESEEMRGEREVEEEVKGEEEVLVLIRSIFVIVRRCNLETLINKETLIFRIFCFCRC